MEEQDPNYVSFKDVAWLQIYGLGSNNALDYFSTSQFYDRTCNNEVVKMQTKFNNLEEMQMQMHQMVGMEYVLAHTQDPILYVIRKQERRSPTDVFPLEYYYIVEGTIFKAPSLYDVLCSRLTATAFTLTKALDKTVQSGFFEPTKRITSWTVAAEDGVSKVDEMSDSTGDQLKLLSDQDNYFFNRLDQLVKKLEDVADNVTV